MKTPYCGGCGYIDEKITSPVCSQCPYIRSTRGQNRHDKAERASLPIPETKGAKKPSKYRNVKTEVDGIIFDSKKEAARFSELKLLENSGVIKDLQLQVKYPIVVKGMKVCDYIADFVYYDNKIEAVVIEDVKGRRIQPYQIKKKLMKAVWNIEIKEV